MRLVHYSERCPTRLFNVEAQEEPGAFTKPNGFWVSVEGDDDGWRDWCVRNDFRLSTLQRQLHIHLVEPEATLIVRGRVELLKFDRTLGEETSTLDKCSTLDTCTLDNDQRLCDHSGGGSK